MWWNASLLAQGTLHMHESGSACDFNLGLRQGLAGALASVPDAPSRTVHLVGFGDCPEDDLSNIENIDLVLGSHTPDSECFYLGAHAATQLAVPLQNCVYCSGLDVWDPLGEALQEVSGRLLEVPEPSQAVLIVGNSPPHLPLEGDSPLRELLAFRRKGSTVRRRNRAFTEALKTLKGRGIPAVYLFLSNRDVSADEVKIKALQRYQQLQRLIVRALSHYLPVVEETADAEGVARGLAKCWPLLAG
jgi:hypothetical protein